MSAVIDPLKLCALCMLLVPAWAFRPPPQASLAIIPAIQLRDAKAKSHRNVASARQQYQWLLLRKAGVAARNCAEPTTD